MKKIQKIQYLDGKVEYAVKHIDDNLARRQRIVEKTSWVFYFYSLIFFLVDIQDTAGHVFFVVYFLCFVIAVSLDVYARGLPKPSREKDWKILHSFDTEEEARYSVQEKQIGTITDI